MSRKIRAAALIAVLYGVAFEQGTPGQTSSATRYYVPMSGRLVGYNGAPMRNQTLFFSGSGLENATTQTDQDGKFRFESVEASKPASLRMAVTGFDPAPIDIGVTRGDLGTVVLQPSGPPVMEHLSANGATETFLSGRITDSNGVPMAGKILLFTNRKVSSFVIVYRVDGAVEKFKLDKSCPFGYVSMDESGRIPPS